MKKTLFVAAVIVLSFQHLWAVPAKPYPVEYQLPDGDKITIVLRGDEFLNWAETPDGFTLLRNNDGFFEYATIDPSGDLNPSGIQARNAHERSANERIFLQNLPKGLTYSESQLELRTQIREARRNARKTAAQKAGTISGTMRFPLILVGFKDKPFTKTREEFNALMNNLDYSGENISGSVRDYFRDNSSDILDVQVDVFGPYTLPQVIKYYTLKGECPSAGGQSREMVRLAVDSASKRGGAVYTDYTPAGTELKTVHVIFAGHGTEAGADGCSSIWSHASDLGMEHIYNDVTIYNYSCSPELRNAVGEDLTHIGVIMHELGHSYLNLPDYYDTDYATSGTSVDLGNWCMMADGVWLGPSKGNEGQTPARLSAQALIDCGWANEVELSKPVNATMKNPLEIEGKPTIYRINTTTEGEYFLLDNRQRTGWDTYIPNSGLLIYHVRRSKDDLEPWQLSQNSVNAKATDRKYYVKQAGCKSARGCAFNSTENREGDTYPRGNINYFCDTATVSADSKSWAGANTNKPVTDISKDDAAGTVFFKFMGGGEDISDIKINELEYFDNGLQAWISNEKIHIKGMAIGETYRIYSVSGQLITQGVAASDVVRVEMCCPTSGTYIIQQGRRVAKIGF